MIEFDRRQFEEYARAVFTTDSPSGCTGDVIALIKAYVEELGYTARVHNKGTLEVDVPGADDRKTVATSAHVDTLGLMVRSVKSGGTLAVTKVGGPLTPTLDGEYCTVLTREGKRYSGTILSLAPAAHVYPDAATMPRDAEHLEVRLDEEVTDAESVKALGIDNGDFVFIDPKFTVTPSGFLKSRFIDDKASAVLLLMLLRWCSEKKVRFLHPTRIYFVVFEEVGHGASALARDIDEFVTVDMGCVGLDLAGSEYAVSICAKDTGDLLGAQFGAADELVSLSLRRGIKRGRASDGGAGKKTSALAEGDGGREHSAAARRNGERGGRVFRRAPVRPADREHRFAARRGDGGAGRA